MQTGIDILEVIEAAKTKPFGFLPFHAGFVLGGYRIPIGPFYLTWKARNYGMPRKFNQLVGEIKSSMTDQVEQRVIEVLKELGKSFND